MSQMVVEINGERRPVNDTPENRAYAQSVGGRILDGPAGTFGQADPRMNLSVDQQYNAFHAPTPAGLIHGALPVDYGSAADTTGSVQFSPQQRASVTSGLKSLNDPRMIGMIGGGVAGGIVGGPPGAMLGAGLGTAGGRAFQNAQEGSPQDAGDLSRNFLMGEGSEALGQVAGGILARGAQPFMHSALGTTPEDAMLAIQERTGVGPGMFRGSSSRAPEGAPGAIFGGKEGVDAANDIVSKNVAKVDRLVQIADATHPGFSYTQIKPTLDALVHKGELHPISNANRDAFQEAVDTFVNKFGPQPVQVPNGMLSSNGTPQMMTVMTPAQPIRPSVMREQIRELQNDVRAYYEQMRAEGKAVKTLPPSLRASKDLATAMNAMLRQIPGVGPELAKANALAGANIDLVSALTGARNASASSLSGLAANPGITSRIALGLTNPVTQVVAQQAPAATMLGMLPQGKR